MNSFTLLEQPDQPVANRNFRAILAALLVLLPWITGCQMMLGNEPSRRASGGGIQSEQPGSWPPELSKMIYVSDFVLQSESNQSDRGVHRQKKSKQPLKRPTAQANPEVRAREIVESMSRSLIKQFNAKGFTARRLAGMPSALPREGWLLQGVFTEAGEGNRLKRATIGLGRGVTRMEAQVAVSNLAGVNPKAPFIVFGTVKNPKKMPGTVVTKNPYVAAAKFVLEKNAAEKDIQKTAEQIVDRILKQAQQFKVQAESVKPAR